MDLAALSVIIAAASVVVAVVFAVLQIRDTSRIRHTELIIQLDPALRPSLEELGRAGLAVMSRDCSDYPGYVEAHGSPMADTAFATVALYYEGLGFLLHRRLIDLEEIEYFVSGSALGMWQKVQPLVLGVRAEYDQPSMFQWFEYLASRMQQREAKLSRRSGG